MECPILCGTRPGTRNKDLLANSINVSIKLVHLTSLRSPFGMLIVLQTIQEHQQHRGKIIDAKGKRKYVVTNSWHTYLLICHVEILGIRISMTLVWPIEGKLLRLRKRKQRIIDIVFRLIKGEWHTISPTTLINNFFAYHPRPVLGHLLNSVMLKSLWCRRLML